MLEKSHQNRRKWPSKGYHGCQVSLVHTGKFKGFMIWAGPHHFQKHHPGKRFSTTEPSLCRQEVRRLKFPPWSTLGDPIVKEMTIRTGGWKMAGRTCSREARRIPPGEEVLTNGCDRWAWAIGWCRGALEAEKSCLVRGCQCQGNQSPQGSDWAGGTVCSVFSYPGSQLFNRACDIC